MWLSASQVSHARLICGVAGAVPAIAEDLRRGHIPNWVCVALLGCGLALGALAQTLLSAFLGLLMSLASCLIFYIRGGMGGGDVKLMAAYGALVGIHQIWPALFLTAVAGALMAVVVSLVTARRGAPARSICYAPAIVAGALLVLLADVVETR